MNNSRVSTISILRIAGVNSLYVPVIERTQTWLSLVFRVEGDVENSIVPQWCFLPLHRWRRTVAYGSHAVTTYLYGDDRE